MCVCPGASPRHCLPHLPRTSAMSSCHRMLAALAAALQHAPDVAVELPACEDVCEGAPELLVMDAQHVKEAAEAFGAAVAAGHDAALPDRVVVSTVGYINPKESETVVAAAPPPGAAGGAGGDTQ